MLKSKFYVVGIYLKVCIKCRKLDYYCDNKTLVRTIKMYY